MIVCLRRTPGAALAAVGFISLLTLSCGGGSSPASSTPPTTTPATPVATPPPVSGGGDSFSQLNCPFGKGNVNATCERRSSALLDDLEAAMDALVRQKPQIFDLNDEYAPGTRAYRVLDKVAYRGGPRRQPARGRPLLGAGRGRRPPGDHQGQELERVLRGLRRAPLERPHAAGQRDVPPDLQPVLVPGRALGGSAPDRQRLRAAVPARALALEVQVHLKGPDFYTLDSTPLVGPDLEYCASVGFLGRTLCPIRQEGAPDRAACENWRVGKAKDTGRVRPDLDEGGRELLHRPGERLRQQPQPVPALHVPARNLRGDRRERRELHGQLLRIRGESACAPPRGVMSSSASASWARAGGGSVEARAPYPARRGAARRRRSLVVPDLSCGGGGGVAFHPVDPGSHRPADRHAAADRRGGASARPAAASETAARAPSARRARPA